MKKSELISAVEAAQRGDREAVEQLYNEWSGRLRGFIRRKVGDEPAVEDILSEVFVAVMEHIGELKTPEAFGGWVYAVAYNKCMDMLSAESRRSELDTEERELGEPLSLPEDYAVNADTRRRLGEMIEALKPEQRSAVLLYYYEQRSVGEVAEAIGKSESAVKKLLQRARGKLRKQIERLCAGGAVFALVPMESLVGAAVDDSYAAAVLSKGAHVVGRGLGAKIAVAGAIAGAVIAVPIAVKNIGGGGYRPELKPLETVRADCEEALKGDYANLVISEGISINIPDELGSYKIKDTEPVFLGEDDPRVEETIGFIFDPLDFNTMTHPEDNIVRIPINEGTQNEAYQYFNYTRGEAAALGKYGYLCIAEEKATAAETVSYEYADRLGNEEGYLKARESADRTAGQLTALRGLPGVRPYLYSHLKAEDGTEYLKLTCTSVIDGVSRIPRGLVPTPIQGGGAGWGSGELCVYLDSGFKVCGLSCNGLYSYERVEAVTEIPTLSSVLKHFSEELAPNYKVVIKNIGLMYSTSPKSGLLVPVWYFEFAEEQKLAAGVGFDELDRALVDCATGRMYYVIDGLYYEGEMPEKSEKVSDSSPAEYVMGRLTDDNAVIVEPEYEGAYSFKMEYAHACPGQEVLDTFYGFYDRLFKDTFTDAEKDEECKALVFDGNGISEGKVRISEVYDRIAADEYPGGVFLSLDTPKGYLEVNGNTSLNGFELGRTFSIKHETATAGMYFPDNSFDKAASYYAPVSDDSYRLEDKSLTVREAADTAEKLIDDLYSVYHSELRAHVSETSVIDLGERYGYSFSVTPSYKGIPFDAHERTNVAGVIKVKDYSNGKSYQSMPAYAFLDRSDSLDILIGYQINNRITDITEHSRILSRRECIDIINGKFSENVALNAYKEELVYTLEEIDESGSVFKAEPAWKFSVTDNNSHKLFIYVNAVTGECYYEPGQ